MEVLDSHNKKFGFYGTNAVRSRKKAEAEWTVAFQWVAEAMPTWSAENIRDFLDSRCGRHLADESMCTRGGIVKVNPELWFSEMYAFAVEVNIANKTPDLNIRVQADTAYRRAVEELKKAEELYRKILGRLPAEKADTPYTEKLREHSTDREKRIKAVLA